MRITLYCFLFLLTAGLFAQEPPNKHLDIGVEVQQYPTGHLLGIRGELGLSAHHSLSIRLGYNGLDHLDFGVHEEEIGGGLGGTLGYRYYFKSNNRGFFLGARSDLWQNKVDWKDNIGLANEVIGNSTVLVFQPTAITGYLFLLKEHWVLTPTVAFGAEINVKTTGAEVGAGAIFLWGLQLAYRIY